MWKTRNIQSLISFKRSSYYKFLLQILLSWGFTSYIGEPNVMQKLDGMNIIQLKVQNHRNTFEATSTTVLNRLSFQMLQKMLRTGGT